MKQAIIWGLALGLVGGSAQAELALYEKDGWKFSSSGFIEFDAIHDSTRSFREIIGNGPVERGDSAGGVVYGNGSNPRTQFSVRNTRLAFTVLAPERDGWKFKSHFEFDFLGYDPVPSSNNTEASFYNNPTLRMRHGFFQGENGTWQWTAGQTWGLLGWQPYYLMPSVDIAPLPGMLFTRTAQVRALRSAALADNRSLQMAVALARPPQADGEFPDLQAGLRLVFEGRKSAVANGYGPRKVQPMSVAVSGALRHFIYPTSGGAGGDITTVQGHAVALNTLIPILKSADGTDTSHTLTLLGEWSTGLGYGDQFPNWTGNSASNLNAATAGYARTLLPSRPLNLDAGIGDYDSANTFNLIALQSWNLSLQYHLPDHSGYWFTFGYGQLRSSNMAGLTASGTNLTSAGKVPYDQDEIYFLNGFRQLTAELRAGAEVSHVITHYGDTATASNNRLQLSGYWQF